MNLRLVSFIAGSMLLFASGCAPSRFVKTLGKGETAISVSTGGPLIKLFGATIPIPFSTIAVGHGIKDGLTVFGGLHTTSLLFSTFQTDLGVTKRFLLPDSVKRYIPGISGIFVANSLVDLKEGAFNFYPEIDLNAYWNYRSNKDHFLYVGIGNWFDVKSTKAHNEPQTTHWIFNPHIGHTWETKGWNYNIEFKFLAPNLSNQDLVVDYFSLLGKKGATGIYLGITKRF